MQSNSSAGGAAFGPAFSAEEEEEFMAMARSEGFYERFAQSVAPSIFGSPGAFFVCSNSIMSVGLN